MLKKSTQPDGTPGHGVFQAAVGGGDDSDGGGGGGRGSGRASSAAAAAQSPVGPKHLASIIQLLHWRSPSDCRRVEVQPGEALPAGCVIIASDQRAKEYRTTAFPEDFGNSVKDALDRLYGTSRGRILLNDIVSSSYTVQINPQHELELGNTYQNDNGNAYNQVYNELYGSVATDKARQFTKTGQALRAALDAESDAVVPEEDESLYEELEALRASAAERDAVVPKEDESLYEWLAGKVNTCPVFTLEGEPATTAHLSQDEKVTMEEIKHYLNTGSHSWGHDKLDFVNQNIVAITRNTAARGAGCGVSVTWNTHDTAINQTREPVIGLAHELVHARLSVLGRQVGADTMDKFKQQTGLHVLAEYAAVGLGVFEHDDVTENSIRADLGALSRSEYGPRVRVEEVTPTPLEVNAQCSEVLSQLAHDTRVCCGIIHSRAHDMVLEAQHESKSLGPAGATIALRKLCKSLEFRSLVGEDRLREADATWSKLINKD